MKKYRFLKDFFAMKQGDIYEFDMDIYTDRGINLLVEEGIIEEVNPKPINRFLLKAEDMEEGQEYFLVNLLNEKEANEWLNNNIDISLLGSNNVFLSEAECDAQVKRNDATAKYLKCVARHNEARGFVAKFAESQENYVFYCDHQGNRVCRDCWRIIQYFPFEYYFHEDDAESILAELGEETIKLMLGVV